QHVLRAHILGVVVQNALQAGDVADGTDGGASDLPRPCGDGVGGSEYLIALLVQQEVIVAEVRTRHVPVKILGLQVQREEIGEQLGESAGNIPGGVSRQV